MAFVVLSLLQLSGARAGQLAIVIDDIGYRPQDSQVLQLPVAVSVAILPDSAHRSEMAQRAWRQGREILIHMPMAPKSKQPLEKSTLFPEMSQSEIASRLQQAFHNVPYAVGMNNHMGSAMTASLPAMQQVFRVLQQYRLRYFLDSRTIGSSQVRAAGVGTGLCVLSRDIFLDDSKNEQDIRRQLQRAIAVAQKKGSAIAIGHPYPETLRVLQQMLPQLPANVVLVKPSMLINQANCSAGPARSIPPASPVFTPPGICQIVVPTDTGLSREALMVLFNGVRALWSSG
ncbi:MAG: divergent polysaccharide deacetylase family protein [Enterobacteriaceae bacterium]